MYLKQTPGSTTLYYEHSDGERTTGLIFGLCMIGLGLFLSIFAAKALFASAPGSVPKGFFILVMAGIALYVAYSTLTEPDRATIFEHATRRVSQVQTGLINKQLGPISFDAIARIECREGFVNKRRAVLAKLAFVDGTQWQLGHEVIRLRPLTASNVPALIAQIEEATKIGRSDAA